MESNASLGAIRTTIRFHIREQITREKTRINALKKQATEILENLEKKQEFISIIQTHPQSLTRLAAMIFIRKDTQKDLELVEAINDLIEVIGERISKKEAFMDELFTITANV